ncbi:MAG: FecR domain-containing protein [Gemmatimonadaceae bacterium]
MPATLNRLDAETVAAFKSGDEHALERVFYAKFAPLVELTKAEVPDLTKASKVVENVILRAWADRAQMDSPLALDSYFERVTHEAAIREKGRLAALHRHDAPGAKKAQHAVTAPTPDDVWGHIKAAIHASGADHEKLQAERKSLSKQHAAEHLAHVGEKKKFPIFAVAGIAAVALAIMAVLFWIPASKEEGKISRALANERTREISTKNGQRGNVKLDDGTVVTLGADSRLRIPPVFPTTLRAVGIEGTASFAVASGQSLPFEVRAGRATIKATGTAFDVSAYPTDDHVTIRVRQGEIIVTPKSGKDETVKAGDAVVVKSSGVGTPTDKELGAALGWIDGRFEVTDAPIKDVLPLLKRWYQLDVQAADKSLLDRKVTMQAGLDSAKVAMTAMETSASVLFDFDGKKWLLRDVAKK